MEGFQQSLNGCYELDELYWYIERKPRTETGGNVYLMTMVSRNPRQIVGFDVAFDKYPQRIQTIVDNASPVQKYCTDGWFGYVDVIYPGRHIRNAHDKRDTYTVEGVNADLRHYIPILARRSRCFARKLETLRAVLDVFVEAYNKFGEVKLRNRVPATHRSQLHAKHLHKFSEVGFSVLDFL